VKPRKGDLVRVEFDDHVRDGDELIRFAVYGRVLNITRHAITVAVWEYADSNTPPDDNVDRYTIARKTIADVSLMVRAG
jgi:hypothetical protein